MYKGFKRGLLLSMVLTFAASLVLSGCGAGSGKGMADRQVFRMNLGTEPPTMDPGMAQDNVSFTVLWAIFEGLTRLDKEGKPVPAVAKSWDISGDQVTYTFHLRDDVKWSNDQPVTAQDFEFAWKRVLNPEIASPNASQLYYLKGAEDYNAGKTADPDSIGVKAADDHTLIVTLAAPTPYFISLTSSVAYMPLNKKSVESGGEWASDAGTIVTNGPFLLAEWKHNDSIVLKKNPKYFEASKVKMQEVDMSMIGEASTSASMFEAGQLDWNGTPTGEIPTDLIPKLKTDGSLHTQGQASIYYYMFNVTQKPFDNAKIRKALSMSINREELVANVTKGGQIPAFGFVTPGIAGDRQTFREEHPESGYFKEDAEQAKQLLAEGLKDEGLDKLPEITLSYTTSENHKKIAEAIADMWKRNLGIDVKLQNQEWKVFLETLQSKNYQIATAGWFADYDDPNTFLDIFTSGSGNNATGFSNSEYDKLIKDASHETDTKKRLDELAQAEKLLIADQMVVIPIYYYASLWQQNEKVKDVYIDWQGNIHFTQGYFAK
ncbi:peptide ABC transporter substrate-binding protein [Ferviditalea candida]|uniref:Peptide ABC transporter substrate-binding protein n=1 Tax=Ferviditalea candida TaxID=3108399 RepID=A0ABU5ZDS3_9BACL|nr:peptide ABC transporter substrate-binding protein [Paenibacillaceae bacterium T2]